ncbi:alpha/beta fold hydrolase [Mycolicibacter sp. MYC123]|uniref:Alpha/beta fold hydrolase n=1 Tax=[Mycobacterium] zoologicum TaxID=2872311 RepID=A0ABU5YN95_9MYCO|nr:MULTISPECIES: alpha/beta fold hydrolase [unclassified Mycolicibacter]MEB3051541.1 alpha/beta fold hydrolase [Mycolicibacter sp. MYC123]MEB3061363.1 alpha/beta fold hydrolase [Mycolicibacter sp. MYC101]
MSEPRWIDVAAPEVALKALSWGTPGNPVALCLHGFPDTAYGWRRLAPRLVAAGWHVVAPFMRGYAPSSIPADGSYHIGALMDDALRVLDAVGRTGGDAVIGHDWGAMAATGIAALPDTPFTKAVIMSVPPPAALRQAGLAVAGQLPAQMVRSWYIGYFQLPGLPERSASWVLPRLWRRWSPGYDAEEDLRHIDAAIGTPESWRAALGPYRALRSVRAPARYADLHQHWLQLPKLPSLYLHGRTDGCMSAELARWVAPALPDGSAVAVVENAGHFLQLEQPDEVADQVLHFLA